jgi:hypothetical protein
MSKFFDDYVNGVISWDEYQALASQDYSSDVADDSEFEDVEQPEQEESLYSGEGFMGAVGDMGRGTMSGLNRGIKMVGDTIEWVAPEGSAVEKMGDKVSDWAAANEQLHPELYEESAASQQAREGSAWNPRGWLHGGFESVGMMAPGIATGPAAPITMGVQFWGGTAQESYDQISKDQPGLSEGEKLNFANLKGGVEGGLEMLQMIPIFGLGKAIPKSLRQKILKSITGKAGNPMWNFAKEYSKFVGAEVGMELTQEWLGGDIDYEYDQRESRPGWDDIKGVIGPTVVAMTVMGSGAAAGNIQQRRQVGLALESEETPVEIRTKAARFVYEAAKKEDAELAEIWRQSIQGNLEQNKPIIMLNDKDYREQSGPTTVGEDGFAVETENFRDLDEVYEEEVENWHNKNIDDVTSTVTDNPDAQELDRDLNVALATQQDYGDVSDGQPSFGPEATIPGEYLEGTEEAAATPDSTDKGTDAGAYEAKPLEPMEHETGSVDATFGATTEEGRYDEYDPDLPPAAQEKAAQEKQVEQTAKDKEQKEIADFEEKVKEYRKLTDSKIKNAEGFTSKEQARLDELQEDFIRQATPTKLPSERVGKLEKALTGKKSAKFKKPRSTKQAKELKEKQDKKRAKEAEEQAPILQAAADKKAKEAAAKKKQEEKERAAHREKEIDEIVDADPIHAIRARIIKDGRIKFSSLAKDYSVEERSAMIAKAPGIISEDGKIEYDEIADEVKELGYDDVEKFIDALANRPSRKKAREKVAEELAAEEEHMIAAGEKLVAAEEAAIPDEITEAGKKVDEALAETEKKAEEPDLDSILDSYDKSIEWAESALEFISARTSGEVIEKRIAEGRSSFEGIAARWTDEVRKEYNDYTRKVIEDYNKKHPGYDVYYEGVQGEVRGKKLHQLTIRQGYLWGLTFNPNIDALTVEFLDKEVKKRVQTYRGSILDALIEERVAQPVSKDKDLKGIDITLPSEEVNYETDSKPDYSIEGIKPARRPELRDISDLEVGERPAAGDSATLRPAARPVSITEGLPAEERERVRPQDLQRTPSVALAQRLLEKVYPGVVVTEAPGQSKSYKVFPVDKEPRVMSIDTIVGLLELKEEMGDISFSSASAGISGRTSDQVKEELRARLGNKLTNLLKGRKVKIVETQAEVEMLLGQKFPGPQAGAHFKGTSYLIAENIGQGEAFGKLLHELGVHSGLKKMLGKKYGHVMSELGRMHRAGDANVMAARQQVVSGDIMAETLAYFVENPANHNLPLYKKILSAIKMWAYRAGLPIKKLTQADLVTLANAALRHESRNATRQAKTEAYLDQMMPAYSAVKMKPVDTESPEFKEWFGDSKVVDEDGNPLVLYHGTDVDFSAFEKEKINSRFKYSFGFHFTTRPEESNMYAGVYFPDGHPRRNPDPDRAKNSRNMPVHIQAKNPLIIETEHIAASMEADLNRADIIEKIVKSRRDGNPYDSVIIKRVKEDGYDGWNVVVFEPTQIKSAISNTGAFSATDPRIQFSKATPSKRALHIKNPEKLRDLIEKLRVNAEDVEKSQKDLSKYIRKLPISERGKQGVISRIIRLARPKNVETRQRYYDQAVTYIDEALDTYLRDETIRDIHTLLDTEGAELKNGYPEYRGTPEVDEMLKKVRGVVAMSDLEVSATLEALERKEQALGLSEAEVDTRVLLELYGAMGSKDRAAVQEAYDTLVNDIVGGKFIWQLKEQARLKEQQEAAGVAQTEFSKDGKGKVSKITKQASDAENQKFLKGIRNAVSSFALKHQSFEWALDVLSKFDKTSDPLSGKTTRRYGDKVQEGTQKFDTGLVNAHNIITDKAQEIFGLSGLRLKQRLAANSVIQKDSGVRVAEVNRDSSYKPNAKERHARYVRAFRDMLAAKGDTVGDVAQYLQMKTQDVHDFLKGRTQVPEMYENMALYFDKTAADLNERGDAILQGLHDQLEAAEADTSWGAGNRTEALNSLNRAVREMGGVSYADLPLSQNQAYKIWQWYQDPTLQASMEYHGYTPETIEQIEKFMAKVPGVREWAEWQMNEFYTDYHAGINDVYKRMYHVNLPFNPRYTPLTRDHAGRTDEEMLLDQSDIFPSTRNGSLKSRVESTIPPRIMDGDTVLLNHVQQMEHFKAWAEPVREMRAVLQSKEVTDIIRQDHGKHAVEVMQRFLDDFARGGVDRTHVLHGMDRLRTNFTKAVIGANPIVFIKQLTSFTAYAMDMPMTDFVKGFTAFWTNPVGNYKLLMQSERMKTRYDLGHERDVAAALKRAAPGGLSQAINLTDIFMWPTKVGDRVAIIVGGYANYRYHYRNFRKQGLSKEIANKKALFEFEKATERTQQAAGVKDLGQFQRGTSMQKLFTMFMTSPTSYWRHQAGAIRNLYHGRGSTAENMKRFAIAQFVLPMMFQFVASGIRWDDEDQLRAAILGPLNGLFIARDFLSAGLNALLTGEMMYGVGTTPVLDTAQTLQYAMKAANDMMNGDAEALGKLLDNSAKVAGKLSGIPYEPVSRIVRGNIGANEGGDIRQRLGFNKKLFKEETDFPTF